MTLSRKNAGVTIVEIIIVIALICLLSAVIITFTRPQENLARARDEKRLSDMTKFEAEVLRTKIDTNYYPDITPPAEILYAHTDNTYEIDVVLEYYTDRSANDGGDNPDVYESGNDLTLF